MSRPRAARPRRLPSCPWPCWPGCSADRPPGDPTASAPLRLDASVAQFRFDEGTRNLKAGVTNDGDHDIRVSQATIAWDGFAFPTVPLAGGAVHPGQTAAFTIAYGAAQCGRPPTDRPGAGRGRRRSHHPAAAARRGPGAARPAARQGLRRRSCSTAPRPCTCGSRRPPRGCGGRSTSRPTGDPAPARGDRPRCGWSTSAGACCSTSCRGGGAARCRVSSRRTREVLAFPVLLGSAHRCDPHALRAELADVPDQRLRPARHATRSNAWSCRCRARSATG